MKILVTGGTGYIGRVLVPMLIEKGYEVTVIDRQFLNYDNVEKEYSDIGCNLVTDDIRYFDPNLLKDHHAVVDLAALSNDPSGDLDSIKTWDINYLGRVRVARMAKKLGVERYIVASSCSVYGFRNDIADETTEPNPLTTYAQANIEIEKDNLRLADDHFTSTALRFSTAFGYSKKMRFDIAINAMTLNAFKSGKIKLMRDGQQYRPFIHVIDMSRSIINVLEQEKAKINGKVYNIGSDSLNVKLLDLANIVKQSVGSDNVIEWYGDPDVRSYRVSFKKALSELNFNTVMDIKKGVEEILIKLKSEELKDVPQTHTVEYYKKLIDSEIMTKKHGYNLISRIL
ncbi:MAG: NAD-dependent epimerase/dehydratase family protein [Thermoplasmataceae archaeon]